MRFFRKRSSGFTLVEVMIAVGILAIGTLATMSALIFTSSSARLNSNAIAAKNIAQGFFERMAIDQFANVGKANHVDPAGKTWTGYANRPLPAGPPYNMTLASTVWIDRAMRVPCSVTFVFDGFGTSEAGSVTSLTDNDASWTTNEWAGDTVFLATNPGAGQFVVIASNTSKVLTFSTALAFAPGTTTKYMINNGKTVTATTQWQYRGRTYSQTIESLVVKKSEKDDLGF